MASLTVQSKIIYNNICYYLLLLFSFKEMYIYFLSLKRTCFIFQFFHKIKRMMEVKDNTAIRNIKEEKKENSSSPGLNLSLLIIFIISVIDLLGFTVILPLMPSIFEHYDSNKEVSVHTFIILTCIFCSLFHPFFFFYFFCFTIKGAKNMQVFYQFVLKSNLE